ncbi:MAG: homoaconitase [Phycisphaerae bacterium]|nr:homoaconitase [Phycisphaerae bacterium]
MAQTLIEKIAQRYAVGLEAGHEVHAGDFLSVKPAHIMTHDNTSAVIPKFESMGAKGVFDRTQPVFAIDHDIQNHSEENLRKYADIEAFAKRHGIAFYPAGRGIGHQVMVEEGFALPGMFVVGSDSHSNLYGAMAALGTPVVRTDAAAIWATGRTWWQVPDIVKVELTGRLRPGVSGKDVIITLCGVFNQDDVLNCCVEFTGPGVAHLRMDERLAIANMTTEWGALAGVFPYDKTTRDYLTSRYEVMQARGDQHPRITPELIERIESELPEADADAFYAKVLTLDLGAVVPFVAGPNEVKTIAPLPEIQRKNVKVDKAYLLSCVNGRLADFVEAAMIVDGHHIAPHVKFYIAAASSEVEEEAKRLGHWQTLVDAGAIALPPGCGPCIGLGEGVLADGEVGISATNRNFKGRMGSPKSQVYLASPAVVAASAVEGRISAPGELGGDGSVEELRKQCRVRVATEPAQSTTSVKIIEGFPKSMEGELLWIPKDNLNTDGIYGKDYTYKEGMSPDEMGAVAMLNYDPEFQKIARKSDIMVGGFNFGSGSSREQAATALKFRGIQMLIAGSYSQTYKRNAFNNGYVVIECPQLVEDLKKAFATNKALTIRTSWSAKVDFQASRLEIANSDGANNTYSFSPLGEVAQELVVQGGFEEVIRRQIQQ